MRRGTPANRAARRAEWDGPPSDCSACLGERHLLHRSHRQSAPASMLPLGPWCDGPATEGEARLEHRWRHRAHWRQLQRWDRRLLRALRRLTRGARS